MRLINRFTEKETEAQTRYRDNPLCGRVGLEPEPGPATLGSSAPPASQSPWGAHRPSTLVPQPGNEDLGSASGDPRDSGSRPGDLLLRPRKRGAAPRSGECARGCHFKLKTERERGGRARGSARRAPGSVPGLRRGSACRPGPAEPPARAALLRGGRRAALQGKRCRRAPGACALREAGREPRARSGGPEPERRPLRRAG